MSNLPDDWSWRAFDQHFGDDQPPEREESEEDETPDNEERQHKWTGMQRGGNPADIDTYEWVRYCEVCGIEDTCEDPLPPCVPDNEERHYAGCCCADCSGAELTSEND